MLTAAISRQQKIDVLFFSLEALTQECIVKFLQDEPRISIVGQAITKKHLLNYNAQFKPDINLFSFTEQNFQIINIIPELHKSFPQAKVVVLTDCDDILTQAYALERGAAGIIQKESGIEMLIRTIKQVKGGAIVVNQKLLRQLLKKDAHNGNKSNNKKLSEIDSITKREQEVIEMIATGMKNKEIAESLVISEATVRHHLSSIYSKLMIDDRLNLVIYAYQHKLVKLSD